MPFDTFIRLTRPMGIHYPNLEGRIIEIDKGVVRLFSVRERSQELLGEVAERPTIDFTIQDFRQLELGIMEQRKTVVSVLPSGRKRKGKASKTADMSEMRSEIPFTALDRIHRAMLLFSLGRSSLLKQVLEDELKQSKRFERLALSLNALYPEGSDERRMLEGVQAAMRGIK
jgi:hypothetical protein